MNQSKIDFLEHLKEVATTMKFYNRYYSLLLMSMLAIVPISSTANEISTGVRVTLHPKFLAEFETLKFQCQETGQVSAGMHECELPDHFNLWHFLRIQQLLPIIWHLEKYEHLRFPEDSIDKPVCEILQEAEYLGCEKVVDEAALAIAKVAVRNRDYYKTHSDAMPKFNPRLQTLINQKIKALQSASTGFYLYLLSEHSNGMIRFDDQERVSRWRKLDEYLNNCSLDEQLLMRTVVEKRGYYKQEFLCNCSSEELSDSEKMLVRKWLSEAREILVK